MSAEELATMKTSIQKTTGISDEEFKFVFAKVSARLEALLGYSLSPSIFFTEIGRINSDCDCSNIPKSYLLPPDMSRGNYKLFPYNWKDTFLQVDPFIDVYAVKLVKVTENKQFVTMQTFKKVQPKFNLGEFGNFIENCSSQDLCSCVTNCKNCVQLAVSASWLDMSDDSKTIPSDLVMLLLEMLEYYANPYRDIKSESVDGHSWSKGDSLPPEQQEHNKLVIKRYSGPFGSITQIPTL